MLGRSDNIFYVGFSGFSWGVRVGVFLHALCDGTSWVEVRAMMFSDSYIPSPVLRGLCLLYTAVQAQASDLFLQSRQCLALKGAYP